jgi:hypothetical protein
MTYLWSPPDYRGGPLRVRRNPQASLYQPVLDPDDWGYDNIFTPNGIATLGDAAEAVSALQKAGTRGAAALGAVAGLLLSSNHLHGAIVGGLLGYFGGKYIVVLADKVLAVTATITKIEKVTS